MRHTETLEPEPARLESQESGPMEAILTRSLGKGAGAAQIADAIVSTWQKIEVALSPIIGRGGVAALYKRSLYLTGSAHPWLAGTHERVQAPMDLPALKSVLVRQTGATAAAGGGALLHAFQELLASLVGPSLTEQLLRAVWADASKGPNGQGTQT